MPIIVPIYCIIPSLEKVGGFMHCRPSISIGNRLKRERERERESEREGGRRLSTTTGGTSAGSGRQPKQEKHFSTSANDS